MYTIMLNVGSTVLAKYTVHYVQLQKQSILYNDMLATGDVSYDQQHQSKYILGANDDDQMPQSEALGKGLDRVTLLGIPRKLF